MAPHKPLMLLALVDLIEEAEYSDGWVPYDIRLAQRFRDYWGIVIERQRNTPDISMPFHALGGERDKIWERFTEDRVTSRAKQTTRLCRIAPKFFQCLHDPEFRRQARLRMIETYFLPNEKVALYTRLHLPIPDTDEIRSFKEDRIAFRESLKRGRDSSFKSTVMSSYQFTCVLTGYRLETCVHTLVQAAHIHQHSKGGSDDPRNGLALTPDAHWMFDRGLWTAEPKEDQFIVKVADTFNPELSYGRWLHRQQGKPLRFPEHSELRPALKYFEWHWKNIFGRRF
jgi:putative restriction endonuclease